MVVDPLPELGSDPAKVLLVLWKLVYSFLELFPETHLLRELPGVSDLPPILRR